MKRAELNYWIDVVIAVAFVISAVSGLVFLLPVGLGSADASRIFGVSYRLWDQLHTWGSLGMIAAVGAHLVLHTKWIVAMSRSMFRRRAGATSAVRTGVVTVGENRVGRRRFLAFSGLILGGGAILAAGGASVARLAGLTEDEDKTAASGETAGGELKSEAAKVSSPPSLTSSEGISEPEPALIVPSRETISENESESSLQPVSPTVTPTPEPTAAPTQEAAQDLCVRCPRGLVNDPYPGRCRQYTDRDGDGICDYSQPIPCG
ncbi:MAG: DUF4405 domain-containing protein [Anaerolineae bacterium]|nr:DUF4405 domain-containing protein [Anaerolineae bacterium]